MPPFDLPEAAAMTDAIDAWTVARPRVEDEAGWRPLFDGYRRFYGMPETDHGAAAVWGWLLDPAHPLEALLARDPAGRVGGLAHFRAMPSPTRGVEIGFLDDLFVDPALRGLGLGRRLLAAVGAEAEARGWPLVRWMTQDDNYRARRLYDTLARRTSWVLYESAPPFEGGGS
ncbi:MAG: GNAT family N-acetyltransferase [Azospirillaceae bacterium]